MNKLLSIILVLSSLIIFSLPIGLHAESTANIICKDQLIKSEVETAHSMLDTIFKMYQKGEMRLDEAKKLGARLLRELRYGKQGYFWADTIEGVNIVLYGKEDVEGKNRLEAQDKNGVFYIKAFIAAGKKGGFVEYWFPKKGESIAQPKRSYVLLFEPFGWVIGTGYYR